MNSKESTTRMNEEKTFKSVDKKKKTVTKKELKEQLDKLMEENKKLKEEIREKKNQLLRALADFQNYRKRMEKELQQREEDTKIKYLNEIVDIYELIKKSYDDDNPKHALGLLIRNLDLLLEREGVTCIDCIGKPFDHSLHHAVTTIVREDYEDNIIVDEIKKGYLIGDKLLRPSQVVVARRREGGEE